MRNVQFFFYKNLKKILFLVKLCSLPDRCKAPFCERKQ